MARAFPLPADPAHAPGVAPSPGLHRAASRFAAEARAGLMDRRTFLTRATALGASATVARGLIGAPAQADSGLAPRRGGEMRIQMPVRAPGDPRLWSWPETANLCRGWLEYLVEYRSDGTLAPMLLEGWEASPAADAYVLHLRPGVHWNTGAAFTAADVAYNFARWCDGTVPGNSMADRMGALRDPATGRLRDGAVRVVDALRVDLTLSRPDIALIVNLADFPAAVVHPDHDPANPFAVPVGTGPYLPVDLEKGVSAGVARNPDHAWWGGEDGAWLDRVTFVDLGSDPSIWLAAIATGDIDMVHETAVEAVAAFDALDLVRSDVQTAATLCVRFNTRVAPFDDPALRRALVRAVDNAVVLELGHADLGLLGENHHVSPIHPDYAALRRRPADRAAAQAALAALAGLDTPLELISRNDSWQALSCDAVAAQLIDAGVKVTRRTLPDDAYFDGWRAFPFSATSWGMRPLGTQVLELAYRSGATWNETGLADPRFDALLDKAGALADADDRRAVMAGLQSRLQAAGVMIQPYWRTLVRHTRPGLHGAEMHPMLELPIHRFWREDAG